MLAIGSLAEVSVYRGIASYHIVGRALGVVLKYRPSVFVMFSRCRPRVNPDAGVSRGIASLRDIVIGYFGLNTDAGMKLRRGNMAQALVKHSVQARPGSLRKRKKTPPSRSLQLVAH
ncbi:unnamed protein product [Alternaria burnsii]|nr:unnamed protein product [Alternaria burnsii]